MASKKTEQFNLISTKTKDRIKVLLENRLTPQTIMIFANEYETFDIQTRIEINKYIKYLIESKLTAMENAKSEPVNSYHQVRSRQNLQIEQKNFQQLQNLLVSKEERLIKNDTNASKEKLDELKKILNSGSKKDVAVKTAPKNAYQPPKPKPVIINDEPSSKLLSVSPPTVQKPKTPKPVKVIAPKVEQLSKSRDISDEEYKKEQARKDSLRKELFNYNSESKKQVVTPTPKTNNTDTNDQVLIPNLNDLFKNDKNFIMINGTEISYVELTNPNHKLFSFWEKFRKKKRINSLDAYLKTASNPKIKVKILKARAAYIKKNNITPDKMLKVS